MKTFYLAGRVESGEAQIAEVALEIESRGHEVLQKWFLNSSLPKPYLSHLDTSRPAAEAMIDAARTCDVFLLFPTDDVLGAAVEFGAALASRATNVEKIIGVINPDQVRQSVFYAHPGVIALQSYTDLNRFDWY